MAVDNRSPNRDYPLAHASNLLRTEELPRFIELVGLLDDDIHELYTGKADLASPTFTGVPLAPTAAGGTNTTQIATTAYVRGEINALIGDAPGLLDTLGEIADALADNEDFAGTVTTSLAGKQGLNANLTELSGLTFANNKVIVGTGAGTVGLVDSTSYGRSIWNVANEAAFKSLVNIEAADILSMLSGVDGAGSLLDADLLDGKNTGTSGNVIGLLDGNNTYSGTSTFSGRLISTYSASGAPNIAWGSQGTLSNTTTQAIISRNAYYDTAGTAYKVWNTSGVGWGMIRIGSNTLEFSGVAGSVTGGDTITPTWNTIWHSGNDGSGSGLDAGLLQGYATGTSGGTIPLNNGNNTHSGSLNVTYSGGNYGLSVTNTGQNELIGLYGGAGYNVISYFASGVRKAFVGLNSTAFQINNEHSGGVIDLNTTGGGVVRINANTVWHSGNDGAGSTLDADTIDGVHAASLVQTSGAQTVGGVKTHTSRIEIRTNGSTAAHSFGDEFIIGNESSETGMTLMSGAASAGYIFFGDTASATVGRIHYNHSTDTMAFGTGGDSSVLAFTTAAITYQGNAIWHSGNDGAGSTLDADLLDGLNSDAFMQISGSQTIAGVKTFTSEPFVQGASAGINFFENDLGANAGRWRFVATGGALNMAARDDAQTTSTNFFSVLRSGTTVTSIALASTAFTWNGNTVWTSGNDGSGSGLDAGLLQGYATGTSGGTIPLLNGNNTHSGSAVFTGAIQFQTSPAIYSTNPEFIFTETDASANEGQWRIITAAGDFYLQALNDAYDVASTPIRINRTGTTIDSIALVSTALTWNGVTLFSTANDGSGSGLDADLWDGNQFATYLNQPLLTTSSPTFSTVSGTIIYASGSTPTVQLLGTGSSGIINSSNYPYFDMKDEDGGTNAKYWRMDAGGNALTWYANNDAYSVFNPWMSVVRSAATVTNITLTATSAITMNTPGLYVQGEISGNEKFQVSSATFPNMVFYNSGSPSNAKYWRHYVSGSSYIIDLVNDAFSSASAGLSMTRSGTTYGTLSWGGNTVWHSGNDGAGSTLDADTVDGYQATTLGRLAVASTWTATQTYAQGYGPYFATSGVTHGIFDYNNSLFIMTYNTADWSTSVRVDATTVQLYGSANPLAWNGQSLSMGATANPRFYMYNNSGTATTLITGVDSAAAWIGTFTNSRFSIYANSTERLRLDASGSLYRDATHTMWDSGNDGAGSGLDADLFDGLDKIYFPYALGTGNWGTTDSVTDMNAVAGHTSTTQRSGHYSYNNPTNSPNGDWVHWINHMGASWGSGAEYGFQIAHGFWSNMMWVRKVNNGTWGSWAIMWNSDNDGAGSGLDADLWDGNQFASYLNQALLTTSNPTFASLTANGQIMSSGVQAAFNLTETDGGTNTKVWRHYVDGNVYYKFLTSDDYTANGVIYSISRTAHTAATFNFGAAVTLLHNGNTIWNSGNDGAGSTLDADLWDGNQFATYLNQAVLTSSNVGFASVSVSSASPYFEWYQSDGGTDEKRSRIIADGTGLDIRLINDAYNAENTVWRIVRSGFTGSAIISYIPTQTVLGALGTTATNEIQHHQYNSTSSNQDYLRVRHVRTATGTDWTSAAWDIYRHVDSTPQAKLRFHLADIRAYVSTAFYINDNVAWHAGNDGAGSGLDADLWDGNNFSTYLNQALLTTSAVTHASLTVSGGLTLSQWTSSNTDIDALVPGTASGNLIQGPVNSHIVIGIRGNDSNDGFYIIDTNNGGAVSYAQVLLALTNNNFAYKGNTIWHAGNDGSGTGLDADLWDGNQFASYLNQAVLTSSSPTFVGWTITSDRSTKENIEDFSNVLPFIRKLQSKTYTSRISGEDHYGLIAQDVLEAGLSRAVHSNNEGQLSLHMADLVALGLQGVKEVDERVTKLENIVKKQARQISRLKRAA